MLAALPAHVEAVAATVTGPALIFDLPAIERAMSRTADAAARHQIKILFAAKSFPHPQVLALAAEKLDGIDLAGPDERRMAPPARLVSVTDPALDPDALPPGPIAITCETVDQIRAVRRARPDAAIGLRVSMSSLVDEPAVGALQAGDGHHRSRFGVEHDAELRALVDAARGARVGLHTHTAGAIPTSPARWAAIAAALLERAARAELEPAYLDLGGAWHGVADRLDDALAAVRAAVPPAIDTWIEPGRLVALDAGYAIGRVLSARTLADRELRVVSISRLCHLRWSPVQLVAPAPRPGHGRKVTFVAPTCFEDDVIGDWIVEAPYAIGDRVAWSGITGYSVAWNRGFAGVPAADVLMAV